MNDSSIKIHEYVIAVAAVAAATAVSFLIFTRFPLINLVMIYLLGTLIVAARGHRGPAALSSTLSVLCFDFFFVPPRFSFSVHDAEYIFTFLVMFVVAMVISHLTIRLRTIAEIARQGEENAKKAKMEMETERLRNSLLSSISHDFRTPLTAIVGSASALLGRDDLKNNSQAKELLETIQEEGERLSRQIQNLLEATRLESGGVKLRKELYPLEEIIGTSLDRLKNALQQRKVSVEIDEQFPPVPMDGLLMEQVFVNLLENAGRHTPAGTSITISAHHDANSVSISVADQGPGLRADEKERVFEKLYRHPSTGGAGLGLSICRAIVNAHGGRIWAENSPQGGATFNLTLPMAPHES